MHKNLYSQTNKFLYGVNCALGPSKSIIYSGDFVMAGFVSTYFNVILVDFQIMTGRKTPAL